MTRYLDTRARLLHTNLNDLARLVHTHRFDYISETGLQAGLQRLFTSRGIVAAREVPIGDRCRIDFTVEFAGHDLIGVEVKVGGSAADVRRQLARYAATGTLGGLLLVTSRSLHRQFDHTTSHGIPVRVVQPAWL